METNDSTDNLWSKNAFTKQRPKSVAHKNSRSSASDYGGNAAFNLQKWLKVTEKGRYPLPYNSFVEKEMPDQIKEVVKRRME